jgi:hypothetical protein
VPVSTLRNKLPLLLCLVLAGLVLVVLLQARAEPEAGSRLQPAVHAQVRVAPLKELSGIVRSRRHPDTWWVHNDSGDTARIFAIRSNGSSILPTYSKFTRYGDAPEPGKQQWEGFEVLGATNVDWEDIAIDENYLYLADLGNNLNWRRDLAIYAISEIDPTASTRSAAVQKWPVHYPEQRSFPPLQWHYDSESLFVSEGQLYVITKHRHFAGIGGFKAGASLYRLDTRHTDQSNALTLVDSSELLTAATAADLSPDGSTLAVLSYSDLFLFDRPASGDAWLSSSYRRIPLDRGVLRQAEALAWEDDSTLLIANEQRDLFRLGVDAIEP